MFSASYSNSCKKLESPRSLDFFPSACFSRLRAKRPCNPVVLFERALGRGRVVVTELLDGSIVVFCSDAGRAWDGTEDGTGEDAVLSVGCRSTAPCGMYTLLVDVVPESGAFFASDACLFLFLGWGNNSEDSLSMGRSCWCPHAPHDMRRARVESCRFAPFRRLDKRTDLIWPSPSRNVIPHDGQCVVLKAGSKGWSVRARDA